MRRNLIGLFIGMLLAAGVGLVAQPVMPVITANYVLARSGSVTAPALTFSADPDTGFYNTAGSIKVAVNGTWWGSLNAGAEFKLPDAAIIKWTVDGAPASAWDVGLNREAAGVLAQKAGTTAQEFRVYGTTTGPKYVALKHNGTNATLAAHGSVIFDASGSLIFAADNATDIGAVGANRPKNVYAAGNYYGNGGTLTGITGATGGVSNTGSTTIASDSDNSGAEDIAFYTSTAARWFVKGGTGHLLPNLNDTYNIGASGTRVLNGYFNNVWTYRVNAQAGTVTDPYLLIDSSVTWNDAADTFTAWKLNVTDTNSAAASLLMDLQIGGASVFKVSKTGLVTSANSYIAASTQGYYISGRLGILAGADGVMLLQNNAANDFARLQFGGTSNQFPALKRTSAQIDFRLADDSAYATARAYAYLTSGGSTIGGVSDGILLLSNAAVNDFSRLQFGGTTNQFPALKRAGTGLVVRLADDSANSDLTLSGLYASGVVQGPAINAGTSGWATTGAIRLANAASISWRNSTDSADIPGITGNASNGITLGGSTATGGLFLHNSMVTNAATGTRYLCIGTTGQVTSSASACSGTEPDPAIAALEARIAQLEMALAKVGARQ